MQTQGQYEDNGRGPVELEGVLLGLEEDIEALGGEWSEPPEYVGAIGRTMFDLPTSEDNTVTVLLPKEEVSKLPSQALVRVQSVIDSRSYLGIVVKGPFAEPDGLRGDSPIVITTAVRGGIFMPRYHGRVQVELIGEEVEGFLVPPRFRPLPNSPVFVLDSESTKQTLRLGGDVTLGIPVGYDDIEAAIPSDKKSVLPRHLGILGTTGGGKSTTVSKLVADFQKSSLATVLIDTEGEYTEIYKPTSDEAMVKALQRRGQVSKGVDNVHVYYLGGRETTCPDKIHTSTFSLDFSRLSPYLFMELLDLSQAQQERYLKAYEITKHVLGAINIFPANEADKARLFNLDELQQGYPKMTLQHLYDVVRACGDMASGDDKQEGFEFALYSPEFKNNRADVKKVFSQHKNQLPGYPISWRIVQGALSRLIRLKVFDNPRAPSLNFKELTTPGKVTILDMSDIDSPRINNLVISEILRSLLEAQDANYQHSQDNDEAMPKVMVIIEEAHEFLSVERIKQMPNLFQQVARIARRGRKRWFGMVFVTQLPQHLPDEVFGLINNYILHKISDANTISRLKRSLGVVDESLWQKLPRLAPGQAVVTTASFTRPLLVNIDPTPCKLRMVD